MSKFPGLFCKIDVKLLCVKKVARLFSICCVTAGRRLSFSVGRSRTTKI